MKVIAILGGGLLLMLLFFVFAPVANNITAVANATTFGANVTTANGTIVDTSGQNVAGFYFGYSNFMKAFTLLFFLTIIGGIGYNLWLHRTGRL